MFYPPVWDCTTCHQPLRDARRHPAVYYTLKDPKTQTAYTTSLKCRRELQPPIDLH